MKKNPFRKITGIIRQGGEKLADAMIQHSPIHQKLQETLEQTEMERKRARGQAEVEKRELEKQIETLRIRIEKEVAASTRTAQTLEDKSDYLLQQKEQLRGLTQKIQHLREENQALIARGHHGAGFELSKIIRRPVAILTVTRSGEIIDYKGSKLEGYSLQRLKGMQWYDLLFPADKNAAKEAFTRIKSNPDVTGFEMGAGLRVLNRPKASQQELYLHYAIKLKVNRTESEIDYAVVTVNNESHNWNIYRRKADEISITLPPTGTKSIRKARENIENAKKTASPEAPVIIHITKNKKHPLKREKIHEQRLIERISDAVSQNSSIRFYGIKDLPPETYTSLRLALQNFSPERLGIKRLIETYTSESIRQSDTSTIDNLY